MKPALPPDDERAVDHLAFALLRDAYRDLSSVLRNLNEASANAMFDMIERRLVDTLSRLHEARVEGPNTAAVIAAAGMLLSTVMDEARGRSSGDTDPGAGVQSGADVQPIGLSPRQTQ